MKTINLMKSFLATLLQLIYPEEGICFVCNRYIKDIKGHICIDCKKDLCFISDHRCSICGKPLDLGYIPERCSDCINHKKYFSKVIVPLEYDGLVKDLIYLYKYGKKVHMYKVFGQLLLEEIVKEDITGIDFIVPVPLYRDKLFKRGFNQAELMSKFLSHSLNIPVISKNLVRIKKTEVQNKLDKKSRINNVKNAFILKNKKLFNNKRVLLVDDIFTTGATVNECSRIILKGGAKYVIVATIATGKNN